MNEGDSNCKQPLVVFMGDEQRIQLCQGRGALHRADAGNGAGAGGVGVAQGAGCIVAVQAQGDVGAAEAVARAGRVVFARGDWRGVEATVRAVVAGTLFAAFEQDFFDAAR